jgi:AcrR family transcriptional regulator
MPSVTRRQTASREERRGQILEKLVAATLPLLEEGNRFTELSVERIVQEAGISRTTFYVYFEDKGDLLISLGEGVMDAVNEAASGWWSLPPSATREQVYDALREVIGVYAANGRIMQAVVEVAAYDDRVRRSFGQSLDESRKGLRKHIERGLADGSIRPGIDPQRTTDWLLWMSERGFYQMVRPAAARPPELDRLAESLTTVVWSTLYEGTNSRGRRPTPAVQS